jgi:hypothetical protein
MPKGRKREHSKAEKVRIFCANCRHCILMKQSVGQQKSYVLRVRCGHGMWKKRSGEEKVYKYFTIVRRTMNACGFYEPMGDVKNFIKELKESLPVKDEIYGY